MPLDGTELADYEEVIREELERYGEDDLMQYFDGSESIQEKIQSAVVTIENKDGILYGDVYKRQTKDRGNSGCWMSAFKFWKRETGIQGVSVAERAASAIFI